MSYVTLSFEATSYQITDPFNTEYLHIAVQPLINGIPLMRGEYPPAFDVGAVIARQADAGHFTPFTCSCGNPGCSNIPDDSRLESNDVSVTWSFPNPYFQGRVSAGLVEEGKPVSFLFDRTQYLAALSDVVQIIRPFYVGNRLVDFTISSLYNSDNEGKTLDEIVAELREDFLYRQEEMEYRTATYGDLLGSEIYVHLPMDVILGMSIENFIEHLTENFTPTSDMNEDVFRRTVVAEFRDFPDSAISLVRTLIWDEVIDLCWTVSSGKYKVDREFLSKMQSELRDAWVDASISVHSFEELYPGHKILA